MFKKLLFKLLLNFEVAGRTRDYGQMRDSENKKRKRNEEKEKRSK